MKALIILKTTVFIDCYSNHGFPSIISLQLPQLHLHPSRKRDFKTKNKAAKKQPWTLRSNQTSLFKVWTIPFWMVLWKNFIQVFSSFYLKITTQGRGNATNTKANTGDLGMYPKDAHISETTMQEHQHQHHDCHSHPIILSAISWFSGLVWPSSHWNFRWLLSFRHKAHPFEQGQTLSVHRGFHSQAPPLTVEQIIVLRKDESPEWGSRFSP